MSIPDKVDLNFSHQGENYDIQLVKDAKSDHSVEMNGVRYALLGNQDKLEKACEILKSVNLDTISNSQDLKQKLSSLNNVSSQKIDEIGTKTLATKQESHAWKENEEKDLPKMADFLAGLLINRDKNSLVGLRGSLGEEKYEAFDQAIEKKDAKALSILFKGLDANALWNIRTKENLHPLGYVKEVPYEITPQDIKNLKQYLDDIGFSGSVSLSDAKNTHTVCPTNQEANATAPFSIGSVAKIFTGVLALKTMDDDAFGKKLALAPEVLEDLEKNHRSVFDQMEKTSLHQAMTHNAGFGDYLYNYQTALENGEKPTVEKPVDF